MNYIKLSTWLIILMMIFSWLPLILYFFANEQQLTRMLLLGSGISGAVSYFVGIILAMEWMFLKYEKPK